MDGCKERVGLKSEGVVSVIDESECGAGSVKECLSDDGVAIEDGAGVRKMKSGKWVAHTRDPKSKVAELKEKLKSEHNVKTESCKSDLSRKRLPCGVRKRENGRWLARVWHPKLNCYFSLGSYDSAEEAEAAFNKKNAEFDKNYGCMNNCGRDCEAVGSDAFQNVENTPSDKRMRAEFGGRSNSSKKAKLKTNETFAKPNCDSPDSVLISKKSKFRSATLSSRSDYGEASTDPDGRRALFKNTNGSKNCDDHGRNGVGGVVKNLEDARTLVKKTRAEFEGRNKSRKKAKFKADDAPAKPSSIRPNIEVEEVPTSLQTEVACFSHSPNEAGNSNVVGVIKGSETASESNFIEPLSLGIINDYGQLMGEYSNLDEMGLNLPHEA